MVLALHFDHQHQLWIGTNQGLALLKEPAATVQWTTGNEANVTSISADTAGNLWFGTTRGLARLDQQQQLIAVPNFPFANASVMAVYHDKDDRLWVGLEHEGLLYSEPHSEQWIALTVSGYTHGVQNKGIHSITMDSHGDIWLGTQHGLSQLRLINGQWQQQVAYHYQRHNSAALGSGKVVSLLEDKDGSLWVGSWSGGVSRLHFANNLFVSLTHDSALLATSRNPATISLASANNSLWVGSATGLFRLDLATADFQSAADPDHSFQFFCVLSREHEVWFGHAQGITAINKLSGEYRPVHLMADIPEGAIRRLWTSGNLLWLAIENRGLFIVNEQAQHLIKQHPFDREITFIQSINEQLVLVGSYSGLFWFDAKTGSLIYKHQLSSPEVQSAASLASAPMAYLATADGRHWLATNGSGLYEILPEDSSLRPQGVRFKQFAEADGLASGQLKAAETDRHGHIWLSSAFGVSVFMPQTGQFRHFAYRHGTLRRDYINGSSTTLADGTIVFGGIDGFTLFQPDQVLAYQVGNIAKPAVLDISINGAPLTSETTLMHDLTRIHIPASGNRSFRLLYSTPEYIETEQVQFQYRLDPLNSDWLNQSAALRQASYDRLPPGLYQFRLRAGLDNAHWSDERVLEIEVLPFWWETWQARLLLFCLLLAMLLIAHSFRLKSLHKKQEEMAWLVEERTDALNEKTKALQESKNKAEQTLKQLESTMTELVRTEKMAALGQLVAGVAHEVNTPLGVALTANSVLTEESKLLRSRLAAGNIRRQEFEEYLEKSMQAGHLLERNLLRAAQLISNFKQVSVDLTADQQRHFNLAQYLNELLESLSLMWRKRQINIEVNCPDNINMFSYPGAIGQIITNFTQNSLIHGFKDREHGNIMISCRQQDNQVQIVFADDGAGIKSEHIARIFDPFFTTNRYHGGTGLGLHIVFNLISQKLGGSVDVASSPGQGTRFTLVLPLQIDAG